MTNKIRRSHGWLGELYDKVAKYTDDPCAEIQRMAIQARADGMSERWYLVLQHRIPFSGFEHKSLQEVANMLGVRSRDRPRQIEQSIYRILVRYLPRV